MRAGRLRHQVTIQQLVAGSPGQQLNGEPDESWTAYLTDVWASIEPLRGRELFAAQEHHSEITTRIELRYRPGVTAKMRVLHGSTVYNILAVLDPEQRHIKLQLLCSDGLNNG